MLRTCWFVIAFVPLTLLTIVLGVPFSFIKPDYLHNAARHWARLSLRLAGVRLQVTGAANVPRERTVIYMPNHQGNFDILALHAALPGQFRWLAKKELFRIPLFGFAMRRCGYIPIDRADRKKAISSMRDAARRIAAGTSVIVFPEGTRSVDGSLLPFKKGGFILAGQAEVPIVPVAIRGSREIMPKGSRSIRGGTIRVDLFPPVETARGETVDRDTLMAEVRRPIAETLEGGAP